MNHGIKPFLREIAASCYDLEWYRAIRHLEGPDRAAAAKARVREAVGYLVRFVAALAILGALVFVPAGIALRNAAVAGLQSGLPDGARFALQSGRLVTNLEQPFQVGPAGLPVSIDTNIEGSDAATLKTQEAVVFGADAVFYPAQEESQGMRSMAYAGLPDISLTKEEMVAKAQSFNRWLAALTALLLVIAWFIARLVSLAIFVLLASFVLTFISRRFKAAIGLGQWFAMGCRIVTLPVLVQIAFGATLARIPMGFAIIYGMFAYFILSDERTNPSEPAVPAPTQPVPPPSA